MSSLVARQPRSRAIASSLRNIVAGEPGAAVLGHHVHALHLGHVGVEVADAADRGGLAAAQCEEHRPVGRGQVAGRAGGQLGLDDIEAELGVGLADEVGVELEDQRVVGVPRLELDAHEPSTGSSYSTHSLRPAPVVS